MMDEQMRMKYYPLIDCDAEGTKKKPMMSVYDEETISRSHSLWLQEFIPNSFRLCSNERGLKRISVPFVLYCPHCGNDLQKWTEGTKKHEHGLYVCGKCRG